MILNKVHKACYSLCLCALLFASSMQAQGALSKEYKIKAALVYHFIDLTQWPDDVFSSEGNIRVCLPNNDELHHFFNGLISKPGMSTLQGRQLDVQKLPYDINACDVVYLTTDYLPKNKIDCKCLVVGDSPNFVIYGAFINFVVNNSRVSFQINQELALDREFIFDEQLLKIASVSPKTPPVP